MKVLISILFFILLFSKSHSQEAIQLPKQISMLIDSLDLEILVDATSNQSAKFRMFQDSVLLPNQIGYTKIAVNPKGDNRNKMTVMFYRFKKPADVTSITDLLDLTFYSKKVPKGFDVDHTVLMKNYTLYGLEGNSLVMVSVTVRYKYHELLDAFKAYYKMKFTNSHYYIYNPRTE